jgi:hypothetical protein
MSSKPIELASSLWHKQANSSQIMVWKHRFRDGFNLWPPKSSPPGEFTWSEFFCFCFLGFFENSLETKGAIQTITQNFPSAKSGFATCCFLLAFCSLLMSERECLRNSPKDSHCDNYLKTLHRQGSQWGSLAELGFCLHLRLGIFSGIELPYFF